MIRLIAQLISVLLLVPALLAPIANAQMIPSTAADAIPLAEAVDDLPDLITINGLRDNLDFVFPSGEYLSGFRHHSAWEEVSRQNMTAAVGVEVTYQAILDQAPEFKDELPTINAYLMPKASQAAAEAQFNAWKNSQNFSTGLWTKTSEGLDYFSYMTDSLHYNDLIKARTLEESSLHLVRYYDNVLIVINLYRTAGQYNKNNVTAFLSYLANTEETLSVLNELVVFSEEALRFFLGSVFSVEGPSDSDYDPDSAEYSEDLTEDHDIPRNGKLSFDLYIDDASETGTILDMNGIDTPIPGVFNVTLNENALLEYSFYDDRISSLCQDDAGWHHLVSETPLNLYEWQTVTVGFGWMEGIKLFVEDELHATCTVNTPRPESPVYLGDYPGDNVSDGFVGYVKNVSAEFTENDGVRLDDLEGNLIFADVSENHPNATAIEYMRDEGIIAGYANGTYRPYQAVNRVEILKMLLLGFGYEVDDNMDKPKFSDIEDDAWYLPYLNFAIKNKIVNGYDNGTYLPSHSLNRAEFLKILLNAYGVNLNDYPITDLYRDTDRDTWFAPYVQYAKDNGLMDPDEYGYFNPGNQVSRAEVAETIYRLLQG
jgi:hypothetical protein